MTSFQLNYDDDTHICLVKRFLIGYSLIKSYMTLLLRWMELWDCFWPSCPNLNQHTTWLSFGGFNTVLSFKSGERTMVTRHAIVTLMSIDRHSRLIVVNFPIAHQYAQGLFFGMANLSSRLQSYLPFSELPPHTLHWFIYILDQLGVVAHAG